MKDLEDMFPCLGPLVNQTVVDQYVEKDNTHVLPHGLVSEVIGKIAGAGTILQTTYAQGVTKSEVSKPKMIITRQ